MKYNSLLIALIFLHLVVHGDNSSYLQPLAIERSEMLRKRTAGFLQRDELASYNKRRKSAAATRAHSTSLIVFWPVFCRRYFGDELFFFRSCLFELLEFAFKKLINDELLLIAIGFQSDNRFVCILNLTTKPTFVQLSAVLLCFFCLTFLLFNNRAILHS